MRIFFKINFILLLVSLSVSIFSNNAEKFQLEQAAILYKTAVSSFDDRDYARANIYFDDFQSLFPNNKLNIKVMEYQAEILFKIGKFERAASKWLDLYYKSPNVIGERALYKAGVLYNNMGLHKKSKKIYKLLQESNSQSVYLSKLKQIIQAENIILKEKSAGFLKIR